MGSLLGVVVLAFGLGLVVAGGELFFDGLLASAASLGISAFVLTVVVSGFELENLAAGIAADLKGLGNAAAGTFLGGTTCMALGVTGVVAAVPPILTRPLALSCCSRRWRHCRCWGWGWMAASPESTASS